MDSSNRVSGSHESMMRKTRERNNISNSSRVRVGGYSISRNDSRETEREQTDKWMEAAVKTLL